MRDGGRKISLSSRLVLGQPRLHRETLLKNKTKKEKEKEEEEKEEEVKRKRRRKKRKK